MFPKIRAIQSIEPFSITAWWSTGELRRISFQSILAPYSEKPQSSLGKLLNPETFMQARLDPEMQTLFWDNLISLREKDGSFTPAPLDFCPDVLFENSVLVESSGITPP